MTTVRDLLDQMAQAMPLTKAAGWDPVGLQIGDPEARIERIGVCHEVTKSVVDRVVESGIDALVAYHPLLFRPTTRMVAGPGPAGRAWRLLGAGVSLIVTHTAFDVARGGAADALAAALDLQDPAGFGPVWGSDVVKVAVFVPPAAVDRVTYAMVEAGAGRIGGYSGCSFRSVGTGTFRPGPGTDPVSGTRDVLSSEEETRVEMVAPASRVDAVAAALVNAHPYEEPAYDVYERRGDAGFGGRVGSFQGTGRELLEVVRSKLGGQVRVAGVDVGPGVRVAVAPGSGASLLTAAAHAGADLVVTGDLKHHDVRRAHELGMGVIDPGHAATERPGVARLYAAVAERVSDPEDLTGVDPDPWDAVAAG